MPEVPVPGEAMSVKFPEVFDIQKSPLTVEVSSTQSVAELNIP